LGIRPVFISNAARNPEVPEGYHFRPPTGWMNDPNGFSKFGKKIFKNSSGIEQKHFWTSFLKSSID